MERLERILKTLAPNLIAAMFILMAIWTAGITLVIYSLMRKVECMHERPRPMFLCKEKR